MEIERKVLLRSLVRREKSCRTSNALSPLQPATSLVFAQNIEYLMALIANGDPYCGFGESGV